jgi:hypothetical protein
MSNEAQVPLVPSYFDERPQESAPATQKPRGSNYTPPKTRPGRRYSQVTRNRAWMRDYDKQTERDGQDSEVSLSRRYPALADIARDESRRQAPLGQLNAALSDAQGQVDKALRKSNKEFNDALARVQAVEKLIEARVQHRREIYTQTLHSLVAAEQAREQEENDTQAKVDAIVTGCTRGLSNE